MEHISKILTNWKGSQQTADMVRDQIRQRWGDKAAEAFDPRYDARPFAQWLNIGYRVKKGEKALKSFVILEEKDEDGKVVKKHVRKINLFAVQQIERVKT